MIEINECSICGSNRIPEYLITEDFFFTKEKFSLSKCESCGFVFTNPIPEIDNIGMYYETEKYFSHDSSNKGLLSSIYKAVRNINLKLKYKILKKYKKTGSLLDIGCGTGEFLNYGKLHSWKVTGIEPNINAREFAQKEYSLNVHNEEYLSEIKNASFDFISMWHVLEHVYNLNERMTTIARLLKMDGFAIIALPMIDSPDSIKFEKFWAGLDVPRHLHHFSSNTFEKLAVKHKFKIIDKYPMKFDSYYVSWLSHQAKNSKLAFLKGIVSGFFSNYNADKDSNYSSMIFVLKKEN